MNPAVFDLLKEATAGIHQRTEERVPIFREDFNLAAYSQLLDRFYGYWAPVETKLMQMPGLNHPELHLLGRLKTRLLIEDLQTLGRDPASLPQCDRLPSLETFPQALGCLYVLEGSSLGARFISKRLAEHLDLHDGSGASFFNAYGESTGRRWLEFKSFVSAHTEPLQSSEIVTAARQTFQCFYDWLAPLAR